MSQWEQFHLNHVYQARDEWIETADGNLHNKRTFNATPIIEAVAMIGSGDRSIKAENGMRHLASIDPITATNWAKECGYAVGTKQFAEYAKKKLMSGDFAHFKSNHKRRFV